MICFDENSRPYERINLETLSADLERYLDPVEAVEKKIKQNNQIRMVISFCQDKKRRIKKNSCHIFENDKMDEIVGQLSKKLAKMALTFTCCPPYSALKPRLPCSQIFFSVRSQ